MGEIEKRDDETKTKNDKVSFFSGYRFFAATVVPQLFTDGQISADQMLGSLVKL